MTLIKLAAILNFIEPISNALHSLGRFTRNVIEAVVNWFCGEALPWLAVFSIFGIPLLAFLFPFGVTGKLFPFLILASILLVVAHAYFSKERWGVNHPLSLAPLFTGIYILVYFVNWSGY